MKILSIETSCDDTCVAVVEIFEDKKISFEVMADVISSQVKIHQKWGGVYPTVAKREHQRNLLPVLFQALKTAKLIKKEKKKIKTQKLGEFLDREKGLFKKTEIFLENYRKPNIDLISVTVGPGLEPCLWVGVNFAKALAYCWEVPIISANHVEGHILVNWLNNKKIEFPVISLVVSGGHTQLILMEGIGQYKILGETRDDAAGECFDKVAKILGLGYPGGPIVAAKAAANIKNKKSKIKVTLPRPMIQQKNYDFSFSGLKTAVLYNFKEQPYQIQGSKEYVEKICAETQESITDVLVKKTILAAKNYKAKTIILGGGVASNKRLRGKIKKLIEEEVPGIRYLVPEQKYCTDNAVMTAIASYFSYKRGKKMSWKEIRANANLKIGDDPIIQR
jgi:N6-L-threonylcarbamoyladenine synthase